MLSIQKSSFNKTWLGIVSYFSTHANSNSACHDIIFVPPCDDTKIDNNASKMEVEIKVKNDKQKSILGAPFKPVKKEGKKDSHHSTNKKNQPKKIHFCYHCGVARHTRPSCYKWLASQQNNCVSSYSRISFKTLCSSWTTSQSCFFSL